MTRVTAAKKRCVCDGLDLVAVSSGVFLVSDAVSCESFAKLLSLELGVSLGRAVEDTYLLNIGEEFLEHLFLLIDRSKVSCT